MTTIRINLFSGLLLSLLAVGCKSVKPAPETPAPAPRPVYFHVDPATAATITGTVTFTGPHPGPKLIDMSEDPACVLAHKQKAFDESLLVAPNHGLANAFVYIEKGLEGKTFETPQTPVIIDQNGCWFHPRVLGLQTSQTLQIVNSDPVTHNIHPMASINREWNHSQGPGDPPFNRRFPKPEVMIPVKCNIHGWMHAYIGVLDHPYFAVTDAKGSFTLPNLPPGTYTLTTWHEKLGVLSQSITVSPSAKQVVDVAYKGK